MKYDEGKPPIHLVPVDTITAAAKVFGFGAQKYGEWNWRDDIPNTSYGRTYSSIQRHLTSWFSGEENDPESGLSHLDHALTQLMILKMQTLENTNPDMDTRYVSKSK